MKGLKPAGLELAPAGSETRCFGPRVEVGTGGALSSAGGEHRSQAGLSSWSSTFLKSLLVARFPRRPSAWRGTAVVPLAWGGARQRSTDWRGVAVRQQEREGRGHPRKNTKLDFVSL